MSLTIPTKNNAPRSEAPDEPTLKLLKIELQNCLISYETLARSGLSVFKRGLDPIILEDPTSDFDFSVQNSEDLNALIATFASIYVELRDIDININMSDDPHNVIQFLDRSFQVLSSKSSDMLSIGSEYHNLEFGIANDGSTIQDRYNSLELCNCNDGLGLGDSISVNRFDTTHDNKLEFREEFALTTIDLFGDGVSFVEHYTITDL